MTLAPVTGGPATRRALEAVVVATAPGHLVPGVTSDAVTLDRQRDLVIAASHARLTGPLLLAAAEDRLHLHDEALRLLHDAHVDAQSWCLRVESRLWAMLGWFDGVGVRALVVKGPAVAHLDEVDPAMRSFGDLDLLVRGDDLAAALGVLAEHGALRPYAERRAGFDRRFAKSVTVAFPDGLEVDVHRTICDGVHGVRVPVERLHGSTDMFELGGRTVHAPSATARTLHAAYHAVLGSSSPRLLSLRDLLGYLGRAEAEHRVDAIAEEAAHWRGTAVLAQAVRETAALPGVELAGWQEWLDRTSVPDDERAIVAAQRRDGSSFGRSRLAAARELPSRRDRAAYLVAVGVPGTRHLRSRGRSRVDVLRSAPPSGDRSVPLPDLAPRPTIDRGAGPDETRRRVLIVTDRAATVDELADREPPGAGPIHVVSRRDVAAWRRRWWAEGRTVTVTGLPTEPGWRGRLRRAAVASGEVRRFDPDLVVVDAATVWLIGPALVTGRTRTVELGGDRPTRHPAVLDRVDRALLAVVRRRHRSVHRPEPGSRPRAERRGRAH